MANKKVAKPKENEYETFLSILPENLRNEDPEYNMYRYWELNGKPTSWFDALNNGIPCIRLDFEKNKFANYLRIKRPKMSSIV